MPCCARSFSATLLPISYHAHLRTLPILGTQILNEMDDRERLDAQDKEAIRRRIDRKVKHYLEDLDPRNTQTDARRDEPRRDDPRRDRDRDDRHDPRNTQTDARRDEPRRDDPRRDRDRDDRAQGGSGGAGGGFGNGGGAGQKRAGDHMADGGQNREQRPRTDTGEPSRAPPSQPHAGHGWNSSAGQAVARAPPPPQPQRGQTGGAAVKIATNFVQLKVRPGGPFPPPSYPLTPPLSLHR